MVEEFHHNVGRPTGIESGGGTFFFDDSVAYAIAMIEGNGINAARRVIDVSGDGEETLP